MSLSGKTNRKENPIDSRENPIDSRKRESKRFHSRRVKQVMLATLDTVEMADKVTAAVEDVEELPQELCHARHQKSGPERTLKVISLPSALATRARMEICSALPWRGWPRTLGQSTATKLPRNGQAARRLSYKSQPICRQSLLGMRRESRQPESAFS